MSDGDRERTTLREYDPQCGARVENPLALVADTRPLREYDFPRDVWCHVLGTKFTLGNQPVDGTMPLAAALLEPWPTDLHITQYTSPAEVRCVKSDVDSYQLRFDFCLFDCDFDHHDERPTLDDFANLVGNLQMCDHQPNLVYPTRGGCRLVYLIEPTTDARWFEEHYAALMEKIETPLINSDHGYRVDTAVHDWGRLFRSARVTRDGVEEFDREIRLFHTNQLDLKGFRPRPKPARKTAVGDQTFDARKTVAGNQAFTARDPKLLRLICSELVPGNRNNAIFSGLCHTYRTYNSDGQARWVEALREAAINAGLDEAEFEGVNKSAQKQPRGE